jgi:hypothetical protein
MAVLILIEAELFDYLKDKHFPDLEKSEGTFDHFDCTTIEKNLYIELKCRHTHYPDLLIEQKKYRRLINQAGSMTPYYINSTPEGIYAFDLSRVPEPSWSEKWMPTTTEFADTRKIMKLVGFLHLDYALPL